MLQTQSSFLSDSSLRDIFFMFCNADGINYVITFFCLCIRRDFLQLVVADISACPSFHLRIKNFGIDIAHKKYHFQRFDVGAGSDKCHGNGDAKIFFIAKISYKGIGVARRISNFSHIVLGKLSVSKLFSKYLFCNFYNLIGMIIVFGKYEGFWNIPPIIAFIFR